MAKYERTFHTPFQQVLETAEHAIYSGSTTVHLEDHSDYHVGGFSLAVRVFERYSMLGGNRVSLNLTLIGDHNGCFLSAISSGGSQAVFFKINTFGEAAFLDTLSQVLDQLS